MKKKYLMPYIFLIFSIFVNTCSGKPSIEFNEANYNFGKVSKNNELKHVFLFKNAGSSTLTIEKITTGWGCTGVLLSKKDIPAGGQGEIEVILKTGTHSGKLKKSIYVYTNDENNKMATLKVEALVSSE